MAIVTQIENNDGLDHRAHRRRPRSWASSSTPAPAALGSGFGSQSGSSSSGATVAGVLPGSPAAQAGLAAGDVIVSVNGQTVDSPTTLSTLLGSHQPGDQRHDRLDRRLGRAAHEHRAARHGAGRLSGRCNGA